MDERWKTLWDRLDATQDEKEDATETTIDRLADAGFTSEDEDIQAAFEAGYILGRREQPSA